MSKFLSDNVAGAHPAVLEALALANAGNALPYGDDELSGRLDAAFSDLFERPVAVVPCLTGTAANALALSLLAGPTDAVLAHRGSHVYADECNAPEFFTGGARMTPLESLDGKLRSDQLAPAASRRGDRHAAQPAALSLSQITERGEAYALGELADLLGRARELGLRTHMDGARFANAVARLGCAPAETSWKAGVDVLTFGATKNGCLAAEAVVLFDLSLAAGARLRAKRAGQLASKMRFVAAQLLALLTDDLWLHNARHANLAAERLAAILSGKAGVRISERPEGNILFARMPDDLAERLSAAGLAGYFGGGEMRLCTSWATQQDDIDLFEAALDGAGPRLTQQGVQP